MPSSLSNEQDIRRNFAAGLFRGFAALIPGLALALIAWYAERGYESALTFGILSTSLLAVLALTALHPRFYPTYGRMALLSYAVWASSSTLWRVFSLAGWFTAEERLHANSLVAFGLGALGFYVMFTHRYVLRLLHYLGESRAR